MRQDYRQLYKNEFRTEQELIAKYPLTIQASSMDKVTFLMQDVGDQIIHFIIELNTQINLKLFEEAIKQVISVEPIVVYNFKVTKRDAYWQIKKDFRFEDLWSVFEGENLEEDLQEFIFQDLDAQYDLPTHIRIFRTKYKDLLCLKVSHAAMDAAGMQEYLAKIVSIYNKLAKNPFYSVKEINWQIYDRSVQQVLKEFRLRKRLKCRRQAKTPKHTWAFPWVGKETT